jgi:hypothetical protein
MRFSEARNLDVLSSLLLLAIALARRWKWPSRKRRREAGALAS